MGASAFPFTVAPGTNIGQSLLFAPTAVICNNYSPFYIYLPDGLTFCAPWTAGAIIPLAHATRARANWDTTPFGSQTITAIPGVAYQANLTFTDDPTLVLSGGTIVTIPEDNRSAVYSAAAGATLTTGALPFTAFGIRVDNYTGTWYQIGTTGILVPPFTTGFTLDLLPPVTSIVLAPATPPFGPPNAATGTLVVATLYPVPIGNSSGNTSVDANPDTRSQVYTAIPGATIATGATPFTAIGTRVDNYTGTWYQIGTTGILVPPFTTGFTLDVYPPYTSLSVAPATAPYGPPNSSIGTQIVLTIYPVSIGNNPGYIHPQVNNQQVFTASGIFVIPIGVTALTIFKVAGGGAGGNPSGNNQACGGGGGGEASSTNNIVTPSATLTVTIGAGGVVGASPSNGGNGSNTTIVGSGLNLIAVGGGGGGRQAQNGVNGACGGGAGANALSTSGGGGGGGMGAVGQSTGAPGQTGGTGSVGFAGGNAAGNFNNAGGAGGTDVNGYGGGGGGGSSGTGVAGAGGGTSGGIGAKVGGAAASPGVANTGGGGGGGASNGVGAITAPAAGGSGIVVISWVT